MSQLCYAILISNLQRFLLSEMQASYPFLPHALQIESDIAVVKFIRRGSSVHATVMITR